MASILPTAALTATRTAGADSRPGASVWDDQPGLAEGLPAGLRALADFLAEHPEETETIRKSRNSCERCLLQDR